MDIEIATVETSVPDTHVLVSHHTACNLAAGQVEANAVVTALKLIPRHGPINALRHPDWKPFADRLKPFENARGRSPGDCDLLTLVCNPMRQPDLSRALKHPKKKVEWSEHSFTAEEHLNAVVRCMVACNVTDDQQGDAVEPAVVRGLIAKVGEFALNHQTFYPMCLRHAHIALRRADMKRYEVEDVTQRIWLRAHAWFQNHGKWKYLPHTCFARFLNGVIIRASRRDVVKALTRKDESDRRAIGHYLREKKAEARDPQADDPAVITERKETLQLVGSLSQRDRDAIARGHRKTIERLIEAYRADPQAKLLVTLLRFYLN